MTMIRVLTKGLLSIAAAIGLFAASNAFADADLMTDQDKSGMVMEVSGDQRIMEIAETDSLSICVANSMVSGDQRRPDRHIGGFDGTSTEWDRCPAHDYMMPMNR